MKKKFKLLTSIASLGLALAVMTFGVFAALKIDLTLKSSVAFTAAPGVYVDVTWSVAGCVETENNSKTYNTALTEVGEVSEILDLGAKTFDETHREIVYTLTITKQADAEYNFNVTVTDTTVAGIENQLTVVPSATKTGENLSTFTYTVTCTLVDARKSFEAKNIQLDVALTPYVAQGD